MLEVKCYASGSSGNCYTLSNGEATIMLDCGLPFGEIMRRTNYKLPDIVLVTHEHKDHSKAVFELVRRGAIAYMTVGTARALDLRHNVILMEHGGFSHYGEIGIYAFNTQHDAAEPCGFLIDDGDDCVLYATDTYYLRYTFRNLTKIMIEANYSKEILQENVKAGIVPPVLMERLTISHFSIENVLKFLKANDLSSVKEIWLCHLSRDNSDPKLFQQMVEEATGKPTFIAGDDT